MRRILLLLFGLSLAAEAQFASELTPRGPGAGEESELPFGDGAILEDDGIDESAVMIDQLRVITLRGGGEDHAARVFGYGDFSIRCDGLTVELAGLHPALAPFLGQPLTANGLDRLIDTVLRYYEANDRPVTDVFAPAQDLKGGVILLEIVEGRIGAVGIESGGIFNDQLLARAVQLRQGDLLRSSDLQSHLDWYNRNPFRPASLYAAPGEGEGEADVVFSFTESRPWRAYTGYANSGSEVAGENRYFAGFNWGNAFKRDQLLSYQFTMGDHLDELQAHSASWEIPIHPWHHFVRLSGTWADISSDTTSAGSAVNSDGRSWQVGVAYGMQLPRWHDFKQELSFGGEFKYSDNFLVFGGETLPGSQAEVVQLRADYRATRRFDTGALELQASLVASPGGLADHNHDDDFEEFRPGATADYLYGRTQVTWLRQLPRQWALRFNGQAQLASGALLPTEQFALGGRATVRGYDERVYLADNGYALSAELRTPALKLPAPQLPPSQLQFLAFLDQGIGWRDKGYEGEDTRESFLGTGAGLRLQIGATASAQADFGFPLKGGGGPKAHLGVTVSF